MLYHLPGPELWVGYYKDYKEGSYAFQDSQPKGVGFKSKEKIWKK
jgi:hypothetical protein